MFENRSFEEILEEILNRAAAQFPQLDTREGSLIYSALAPAAAELHQLYSALHYALEMSYADTATREFLVRRAAERGMEPRPATHAVLEAVTTPPVSVAMGTRFRVGDVIFAVTGSPLRGVYHLTAETAGIVGNVTGGALVPIAFVPGLQGIELRGLFAPARDEEDTESFRQRVMNSFQGQAFGGNIADYRERVLGIAGVGGVMVRPAAQGSGTVEILIMAADFTPPSAALVQMVQNLIDPPESSGMGEGLAPIGHQVTVAGVRWASFDVTVRLMLEDGLTNDDVRLQVIEVLDNYFLEVRRRWGIEPLIVRSNQMRARLMDIPGVLDALDQSGGGPGGNVMLGIGTIPRLGTLQMT